MRRYFCYREEVVAMKPMPIRRALKKNSGFLYILPSLILISLFSLIPLCMTFYYSFTKFNVIQLPQWIGLQNYFNMFKDPFFSAAVKKHHSLYVDNRTRSNRYFSVNCQCTGLHVSQSVWGFCAQHARYSCHLLYGAGGYCVAVYAGNR